MSAKAALPLRNVPIGDWRRVFEAALLEKDNGLLPNRLRDAKNAVMNRSEDSFDTASFAERKLLLAALNTISELQRLAKVDELPPAGSANVFGQAA